MCMSASCKPLLIAVPVAAIQAHKALLPSPVRLTERKFEITVS